MMSLRRYACISFFFPFKAVTFLLLLVFLNCKGFLCFTETKDGLANSVFWSDEVKNTAGVLAKSYHHYSFRHDESVHFSYNHVIHQNTSRAYHSELLHWYSTLLHLHRKQECIFWCLSTEKQFSLGFWKRYLMLQ